VLAKVKVQYRTFPGWNKDISKTLSFDDLPKECKGYIQFIEEFTGVPIGWIGIGPGRESMIRRGV
jgi:adenylosuccinate synthase